MENFDVGTGIDKARFLPMTRDGMRSERGILSKLVALALCYSYLSVCATSQQILLGCKEDLSPTRASLLQVVARDIIECSLRSRLYQVAKSFSWHQEKKRCYLYEESVYGEWDVDDREGTVFCLQLDCVGNMSYTAKYEDFENCLPYRYFPGVYGETYLGVGNGVKIADLKLQKKYQLKQPDFNHLFPSFLTPWKQRYDNVAYELTAFFKPPSTGIYQFGVNSDNGCEVLLSTNEEEKNFRSIIASPQGNFYLNAPLMSDSIFLLRQHFYLMRGTVKEGSVEDYIQVGVKHPNGTYESAITARDLMYSPRWIRK